MRFDPSALATTPRGWRRGGMWSLPVRWTTRRTIAEEHRWRHDEQSSPGWWDPEQRLEPTTPNWQESERQSPLEIAAIYRQLRKAVEDRKDEPGAADLYYGEMEMRRHAAKGAERALLTAYWLFSGYGLRAFRATAALVVTIAIIGVGFYLQGIDKVSGHDPSVARGLFYSLESAVSLFKIPEEPKV